MTPSATLEAIEKFVPPSPAVAPSGKMVPGSATAAGPAPRRSWLGLSGQVAHDVPE